MLITKDHQEAEKIAQELDEENRKRQQIENNIFKEACQLIEESGGNQRVLVLASSDWHPGVIGISASRLVEKYFRPTILIALEGNFGHGSARSIEAFHIYNGLKECQELLEKFGGHEYAAGLRIAKDNIPLLREKLNHLAGAILKPEDFVPKLYIDAKVNLNQINEVLIEEIQSLAPFGTDNPEPVFVSEVLSVNSPQIVGNGHLKLRLGNHLIEVEAIGFGMGQLLPESGSQVRVVFIPEINQWQGVRNLRIKLKDIEILSL